MGDMATKTTVALGLHSECPVLVRKDTVHQGICVLLGIGCTWCVLHGGLLGVLLRLDFVARGSDVEDVIAAAGS